MRAEGRGQTERSLDLDYMRAHHLCILIAFLLKAIKIQRCDVLYYNEYPVARSRQTRVVSLHDPSHWAPVKWRGTLTHRGKGEEAMRVQGVAIKGV